ncbi:MAG: type II toxin-antitoxin system PemK/MazF family toxin [Pseudomonadota bacterium]|nr:type II toxin-antitoxin system PemK/MazF family toxin [Pseudomonadota bacterium]
MALARGDLVTVALSGDYGKPRPALVVQDDAFMGLESVTVLLLTSELREAPLVRIAMQPSSENGLQRASDVMIDKAATVPRSRLGARIGLADAETLRAVDLALTRFLGLGPSALAHGSNR